MALVDEKGGIAGAKPTRASSVDRSSKTVIKTPAMDKAKQRARLEKAQTERTRGRKSRMEDVQSVHSDSPSLSPLGRGGSVGR